VLFCVLVFAKPLCALSVAPSTVEVNSCILCLHILYMCSSRRLALANIEMLPRVVQVHRGVYVAAEILYERFKPMVEEQLASSPFAKIAFTVSHSQCSKLASLILQDKTVFTSCSNHKHVVNAAPACAYILHCTTKCVHAEWHFTSCCFCIAGNLH